MPTATQRSWKHKSVRTLIAGAKIKDPAEIVRQRAREVIAKARSYGWSGPPFNPQVLASVLGIKCKESRNLFSTEAQLTPQKGRQLLLEFNPDRPGGRRNYSICHEIVHTFFDDCYERVHRRSSKSPSSFEPDDEVEQLCQIGAAELLMPEEEFLSDLDVREFSLATMLELRTRYEASREAVLRRMVHLDNRPCAAVFFNRRLSPREKRSAQRPTLKPKMRILYSVRSHNFETYLPPHKSVPDSSCVAIALTSDKIQFGSEKWEIAECGFWRVEALRLLSPEDVNETTPSVAALVLPD